MSSALVTTIAHATEDPDKVILALTHVCPYDLFPWSPCKRKFKGHYGNEITLISFEVRGRAAQSLFEHLARRLSPQDRSTLARDIESHIDEEERLHLRIDKQSCLTDEVRLGDEDPIKIRLTPRKISNLEARDGDNIIQLREVLASARYERD